MAEEYAYVLDYLPQGMAQKYDSHKSGRSYSYKTDNQPRAILVGENFFTLLEVIPRSVLQINEKVYVGKGLRDKVLQIKKRLFYSDLTDLAKSELLKFLQKTILEKESKFVDFFNNSSAISLTMHQLQLLPGIGKKHLSEILMEREKKRFESFKDISERVSSMPDPKALIIKRILQELEGQEKYYLFTRKPHQEEERVFYNYGYH
jgi:putative nucleotide binding protein